MTEGNSGSPASARWLPWLGGGISLACLVVAAVLFFSAEDKKSTPPLPVPQVETPRSGGVGDVGAVEAPANERPTRRRVRRRRVASLAEKPHAPDHARVEIPEIGVDAKVIDLGLNRDGSLEVPTDFSEVGWWAGGPRPGDEGPAVLTGHVDSRTTGPGVFYRLGQLDPGDEVRFVRPSGRRVRFIVERSERYPKKDFPTLRVYGETDGPELRLITCTGDFNTGSGHYLDNLVVFARPAERSD